MIRFSDVSFSFQNKPVLEHFSYTFQEKKGTLVMGPSGRGKTTLLRLLCHLLKPNEGSVICDQKIAVCFQEPRLFPTLTCLQNLITVLPEGSEKENTERAMYWLDKVGLLKEYNDLPATLSGGMQKRLALSRCLLYSEIADCGLILLDEPFTGLNESLRKEMRALVKTCSKGKTLIIISHDEEDREAASDDLLIL